jgi:hypothetical protein
MAKTKVAERFCKYYVLETSNPQEVGGLERELKKKLLQENHSRKLFSASAQEIAEAMECDGKTELVIYDSGEFDVLYSKNETIKRRGLFCRQGLYGIELVVKATTQDLIDLQRYLETSNIDVREARSITKAIVNLTTIPIPKTCAKNFTMLIENLAKTDFSQIKGEFNFVDKEIRRSGRRGYPTTGIYSGSVEDILRFRNTVIKIGESDGNPIGWNSVSFQ